MTLSANHARSASPAVERPPPPSVAGPSPAPCDPAVPGPPDAAAPPSGLRQKLWARRQATIAAVAVAGISAHLLLRFGAQAQTRTAALPLLAVLALGGLPLVSELA